MRRGFTLIELLAVIVILAIIAVIAVPIVLNIIDETKDNATLRSAEFYLDAVEYAIADAYLYHGGLKDGEYPITLEGNLCKTTLPCSGENILKVEVTGEKPSSGTITIINGNISDISLIYKEKTITKDKTTGNLVIAPSNTSSLADDILKRYGGKDSITELTDFTTAITGLYKAQDDYGTSYYFRGDVTDNYVKFGQYKVDSEKYALVLPPYFDGGIHDDLVTCSSVRDEFGLEGDHFCQKIGGKIGEDIYWRIVRINGDGTIRLIYAGTEKKGNNNSEGFVDAGLIEGGYDMDYANGLVKTSLEKWYLDNFATNYNKYIADSIFCNDKSIKKIEYFDYEIGDKTTEETENIILHFKAADRIRNGTPSLQCENKTDRYTVADDINGTIKLTYPIGILTADEALMGGIPHVSDSYLKSLGGYWTSTPIISDVHTDAVVSSYVITNYLASYSTVEQIGNNMGYRPVINLKADVKFIGNGSFETPYEIVME